MQPTRWEILQLLKRRGRATVDELARSLNMTLMGVRLHLVVIERDGYIRRNTVRQKPGRPALVYSLTPKAEEVFPKRYDLLAEKLLEALAEGTPPRGPAEVLEAAAHRIAVMLPAGPNGASLEQRVGEASRVLDDFGAFADWSRAEGGYLIHQCNCLYYQVAQRNRQVCRIDDVVLQQMLGVPVQQRECLLDGGTRCSHFVSDED